MKIVIPTIILISGQVDPTEVYRRAAQALGLPTEFHELQGKKEKQGLVVIRPGAVEEEIPTGVSQHDVAVWTSPTDMKLRWNKETWPQFYCEIHPLKTPTALVYMERTWFDIDPPGHAAAVEAVTEYCNECGAKYWWTSMFDGFGWRSGEPLWMNHTRFLGLLLDPDFPIS